MGTFLFNYGTLVIGAAMWLLILALLLVRRKTISSPVKVGLAVLLAVLTLYFVFILWVSITAGGGHPGNGPVPTAP